MLFQILYVDPVFPSSSAGFPVNHVDDLLFWLKIDFYDYLRDAEGVRMKLLILG